MTHPILLAALGAGAFVLATSTANCVSPTFIVNSAADATALADCSILNGDVLLIGSGHDLFRTDYSLNRPDDFQIDPGDATIDLSGPTQISGDLILENNEDTVILSSRSLTAITGAFALSNVTFLSTLVMPALTSVGSIRFESLPSLTELNFTSGITAAENISITGTFLRSLDGIEITSVGDLRITDNNRLIEVDLPIRNITGNFTNQQNGWEQQISLPDLVFAETLTISGVTSFEAPRLETIERLARFDNNEFTSLTASALGNCGDLFITNSPNLTTISFPAIKAVSGQLFITNNTKLAVVDGFKDLATVDDNVKIRGLLSEVQFPSLENVDGDFEISSANDISDSCESLKRLAPIFQCGGGHVHGTFACLSNNEDFNKTYCTNSSDISNTGTVVHAGTGTRMLGLALVLLSALF